VHAEHVQTPVLDLLVKRSEPLHRRADGDVSLLRESLEQPRSFWARQHAVSAVDDGSLGLVDERGGLGDEVLVDVRGVLGRGTRGEVRGNARSDGLDENGGAEDGGGDVLGEVDEDRTGTSGGSDLEGLVDSTGELGDVLNHDVPLGTRTGDTDDVRLLEGVGTDGRGGDCREVGAEGERSARVRLS
jgi:hypothetical protein